RLAAWGRRTRSCPCSRGRPPTRGGRSYPARVQSWLFPFLLRSGTFLGLLVLVAILLQLDFCGASIGCARLQMTSPRIIIVDNATDVPCAIRSPAPEGSGEVVCANGWTIPLQRGRPKNRESGISFARLARI